MSGNLLKEPRIYIYIYIYSNTIVYVHIYMTKIISLVEGDPKAPFR